MRRVHALPLFAPTPWCAQLQQRAVAQVLVVAVAVAPLIVQIFVV